MADNEMSENLGAVFDGITFVGISYGILSEAACASDSAIQELSSAALAISWFGKRMVQCGYVDGSCGFVDGRTSEGQQVRCLGLGIQIIGAVIALWAASEASDAGGDGYGRRQMLTL